MSTQEKINRIRLAKAAGKILYTVALIVILALIFIRIDSICSMQVDTLNQMMEHRIDTEKPAESEADSLTSEEITESTLSDEDREYIARVLMREAGGSLEGMVAVATTIKDRGDLWAMEYIEVVTAPQQYAEPIWDRKISDEALAACRLVFDDGVRAFEEPTTHFHSDTIDDPYWTANKVCRGNKGGNIFYY